MGVDGEEESAEKLPRGAEGSEVLLPTRARFPSPLQTAAPSECMAHLMICTSFN